MSRLEVPKTYKLYINGKFPRTESGRSLPIHDAKDRVLAHICHGSRKDVRDAVEAARAAQPRWAGATSYNRGQVLYRMAEMVQGKQQEFAQLISATTGEGIAPARKQVDAAIDRLVCFGGWADKYAQVLGCNNPVAGPYYNFTIPEPTGVVVVVAPDDPPLLGLVSLMAPPLCAGNAVVVIASEQHPLAAAIFGEVCATSDVPAGVVNIITAKRNELLSHIAEHRNVDAISAANLPRRAATQLRTGAAENLKRVRVEGRSDKDWYDPDVCDSPWQIEPFVDMKTIWHPSAS